MYVNTPSPTNALPCFTSGWVYRETLSLDGENGGERRKVGVREGGGEDRQESGEGSKVKRKGRVGCGSSLQVMSFNWRYTHVQYVHIIIHVHVIIP